MTFATEITYNCANPRTSVLLTDGVTTLFASHSAQISGTTVIPGTLLSISPITYDATDGATPVPGCDITIADVNKDYYNQNIDIDWTVTVFLGFSPTEYRSWVFTPDGPPQWHDGRLTLRLIGAIRRNLGYCNLPTLTEADVDAFTGTYDKDRLVGKTFPIYYGNWVEEGGAIQATLAASGARGESQYYFVCVTDGNYDASGKLLNETDSLEVFIEDGTGRRAPLPQSMGTNLIYWDVVEESIARPGEWPSSWKLIGIELKPIISPLIWPGNIEVTDSTRLFVNIRPRNPTTILINAITRQDGEDAVGWTPADVIRRLCLAYLDDGSVAGVGTDGYDNASINIARDALEDAGIFTRLIVDAPQSGIDIVNRVALGTQCRMHSGDDGKLNTVIFADTSSAIGGYASSASFSDWAHCLEPPALSNTDIATQQQADAYGATELLVDTAARDAAGFTAASQPAAKPESVEKSAAYQIAWRQLQEARNSAAAKRYSFSGPLVFANLSPLDIILLTERWSAITNEPQYVERITFDLQNLKITLQTKSLAELSSSTPVLLANETDYARTYPTTTATVTNGSGVVNLSTNIADTYTIAVNDIFEADSSSNQASSKVTVAPTWSGSVWQMTVANTVWTNEAIAAADWRVYQSWLTAASNDDGFVADIDDEFSNGDPGRPLVTR